MPCLISGSFPREELRRLLSLDRDLFFLSLDLDRFRRSRDRDLRRLSRDFDRRRSRSRCLSLPRSLLRDLLRFFLPLTGSNARYPNARLPWPPCISICTVFIVWLETVGIFSSGRFGLGASFTFA